MRENARKSRDLARAMVELKQAQTALVQRERLATLGQMTAGVAHEINNPLAFVTNNEAVLQRDFDDLLGFINAIGALLEDDTRLPQAARDYILDHAAKAELTILAESIPRKLRDNREGLARIRSVIQDLRAQTRVDEAEWKLCDLVPGLEATVRFLGPLCHDHDVSIETRLEDLGQVTCSPAALNQAVSIVLTNAVQASPSGQRVSLSLRGHGDEVVIEISDQGTGIAAEHLGRVFEPFFTTKAVGDGMGLGLGIARQILDRHQGRIELESAIGKGTCVRLIFPRGGSTMVTK
jgi:signal transduction histidine kinase